MLRTSEGKIVCARSTGLSDSEKVGEQEVRPSTCGVAVSGLVCDAGLSGVDARLPPPPAHPGHIPPRTLFRVCQTPTHHSTSRPGAGEACSNFSIQETFTTPVQGPAAVLVPQIRVPPTSYGYCSHHPHIMHNRWHGSGQTLLPQS